MSKKAVHFTEKELPPIPRSYQSSQRSVPELPEVYYRDGLCLRVVSPAVLQVQPGEGLEKSYEALEASPNAYELPALVLNDEESMSIFNTSRRRWGLAFVAIGIIVALAVGLGAGLGSRKSKSTQPSSSVNSSLPALFNATTPLPKSKAQLNDWRGRSIYQVMTDRFSAPDPTSPCDVTKRQYCGGTWQGIISRLDYIQNMGFTAENTAEGEAYHGYWQQNIFALNSHFGTIDDLQALANALHDRNMYLMVDVVVNHFAWAGKGKSFNYRKIVVSLPDVNTTSTFVRKMFADWIGSLVSVFGVDGLRIDTVRHVEKSFWPGFKTAAGVYTLGEVLDGDMAYTCPYQEQLDGLLNYPLYYPLIGAFQEAKGNMTYLGVVLNAIQDSCKDPTLLAIFSENHDNPRFLSQRNDMAAQMNVIVFTILAGGIPIIYQGQEQGFSGGEDPANREALWTSGYSTESPLYKLIASVNQVRNHVISAAPDYLSARTSVIYTDNHHIALRKGNLVSLYSNEGSTGDSSNVTLKNTGTGFQENQAILEILACKNITADENGNLEVSIQDGQPQIFYPSAELKSSGICSS
ncbi:MAG: hypothetical protein Q9168_002329 [Polycauliona sp. 1 TL-2023]